MGSEPAQQRGRKQGWVTKEHVNSAAATTDPWRSDSEGWERVVAKDDIQLSLKAISETSYNQRFPQ